mgnify:CR=1 FL=1
MLISRPNMQLETKLGEYLHNNIMMHKGIIHLSRGNSPQVTRGTPEMNLFKIWMAIMPEKGAEARVGTESEHHLSINIIIKLA